MRWARQIHRSCWGPNCQPGGNTWSKKKKRSFIAKGFRAVELSGTSPSFGRMYLSHGCPTNELQKQMTCWRKSTLELPDLMRWSPGFRSWCWNNELRLLRLLGWTEYVLHVTNMQIGEPRGNGLNVCLRVDKAKRWGPHLHLNYINGLRSWECRQHFNSPYQFRFAQEYT